MCVAVTFILFKFLFNNWIVVLLVSWPILTRVKMKKSFICKEVRGFFITSR